MRTTIQRQLLTPMLAVVLLAIALASAASAYLGGAWARRQQLENLARVVGTLQDAAFPLSNAVLEKMKGLSGAELVLLDPSGEVQGSTLKIEARLEAPDWPPLDAAKPLSELTSGPSAVIAGRRFLAARVPLVPQAIQRGPLSLVVLYPEERWWTASREAALPPLVAGAAAASTVVLLTTALARRWVRPIERLSLQAERIAAGDFGQLELPARDDEIRDLFLSLDRMRQRLGQYETEVRRNERLRTLGQLGAGLAHQLRNWATGARMALDLHRRECPLEPECESLDVAARQMSLIESYLKRFLTLGQAGGDSLSPLALARLVEEVVSLVRPTCEHARIRLSFAPPASPHWVMGNAESLRNLLVNLVLNAAEAARTSNDSAMQGAVEIELCERPQDRICLLVRDTGPGPPAEVADRVFDEFVSSKPDGAGLGLAVARQVIQEHGGTISWRREQERTVFAAEFPACRQPVEAIA